MSTQSPEAVTMNGIADQMKVLQAELAALQAAGQDTSAVIAEGNAVAATAGSAMQHGQQAISVATKLLEVIAGLGALFNEIQEIQGAEANLTSALNAFQAQVGTSPIPDTAPVITAQPSSLSVFAAGTAVFTVMAAGTAPLSYQWRKGGVPLSNGGIVSGALTATLTLTDVSSGAAGNYDVVVTNTAGSATSSAASLSVSLSGSVGSYYVAANGSDSNPGTIGSPWQTVAKVNATATDGFTVYFRGGDRFEGVISLKSNTSYTSYGTGRAIISGGVAITTWTQVDVPNNIWRASWNAGRPRALYVDNARVRRARTATALPSGTSSTSGGYDTTGSSSPGYMSTWGNKSDIEIVYVKTWRHSYVPVSSVVGNAITMLSLPWENFKLNQNSQAEDYSSTYIENAYEIFTANHEAGTYYQDRTNNYVYLIPPDGVSDPNSAEVIAPVLDQVVTGTSVSQVGITNLEFAHTTNLDVITLGFTEIQADIIGNIGGGLATIAKSKASIALSACTDVTLTRCLIRGIGNVGVDFDSTCADCGLYGNIFYDISASGITIGGPGQYGGMQPTGTTVSNNFIAKIGQEFFGAVGFFQWWASESLITHNEVSFVPYTGMSMGIGWGVETNPNGSSGNVLSYNRIHDYLGRMIDGGGIYCNSHNPGLLVDRNYIYNATYTGTGTIGVYTDNGSQGFTISNNILVNSGHKAFYANDNINGNTFSTNYANVGDYEQNSGPSSLPPYNTYDTLLRLTPFWSEQRALEQEIGMQASYADVKAEGDALLSPPGPAIEIDDGPVDSAIVTALQDNTLTGLNARLGPDAATLYPGGLSPPTLYVRPTVAMATIGSPPFRTHFSEGLGVQIAPGTWDFASTQAQYLHVSDTAYALIGDSPNNGLGLGRMWVNASDDGVISNFPDGDDLDSDAYLHTTFGSVGHSLGRPIMAARAKFNRYDVGVVLFDKFRGLGWLGMFGTNTATSPWLGQEIAATKIPICVTLSSQNELILVGAHDTATGRGQVGIFYRWGGGDKLAAQGHGFAYDWAKSHPGLMGSGMTSGIKLFGWFDLPVKYPTNIDCVFNDSRGSESVQDSGGFATYLSTFNLDDDAGRAAFLSYNDGWISESGKMVITDRYTNKMVGLDLTALVTGLKVQYFRSQTDYDETAYQNPSGVYDAYDVHDPMVFPWGVEAKPAWAPTFDYLVTLPATPRWVMLRPENSMTCAVACSDGYVRFYDTDGNLEGSVLVGDNPVHICLDKYNGNRSGAPIVTCRGDASVNLLSGWGAGVTVVRKIQDSAMVDPVACEIGDTHNYNERLYTVADCNGKQLLQYRDTLLHLNQTGVDYGIGPPADGHSGNTATVEGYPPSPVGGHPFGVSDSNVN